MPPIDLKTAPDPLLAEVLALNAEVEAMTSAMDLPRLRQLLRWSAFAPGFVDAQGHLAAFLIGFGPGSRYDSPNYRWFADRLDPFAYIDRVVVAAPARGRGHARALYSAFAAHASERGLGPLVCEVNLTPPNPGSDAFHAALGFTEAGRAELGRDKSVRYLMRAPD
ncbi:MAG: GNAT family N-acetyltransferase [Gemmobacter sp.]